MSAIEYAPLNWFSLWSVFLFAGCDARAYYYSFESVFGTLEEVEKKNRFISFLPRQSLINLFGLHFLPALLSRLISKSALRAGELFSTSSSRPKSLKGDDTSVLRFSLKPSSGSATHLLTPYFGSYFLGTKLPLVPDFENQILNSRQPVNSRRLRKQFSGESAKKFSFLGRQKHESFFAGKFSNSSTVLCNEFLGPVTLSEKRP